MLNNAGWSIFASNASNPQVRKPRHRHLPLLALRGAATQLSTLWNCNRYILPPFPPTSSAETLFLQQPQPLLKIFTLNGGMQAALLRGSMPQHEGWAEQNNPPDAWRDRHVLENASLWHTDTCYPLSTGQTTLATHTMHTCGTVLVGPHFEKHKK